MNTISSAFGNPNGAPATIGGTGTTAKVFNQANNSANAFTLVAPGSYRLEGQQFAIRAGGRLYVHGTSPTVNIVLQSGTSLTSTSNTTIATLGSAQSLTTATNYPWFVEAILQGDSTSGDVQGAFRIGINNTISAWAALSNALTSTNFATEPPLQFVVGITFSVSDSANLGVLDQFSLES